MEKIANKLLSEHGIYGILILILLIYSVSLTMYLVKTINEKTKLSKAFSVMQSDLNTKIQNMYKKYSEKVESLLRERREH